MTAAVKSAKQHTSNVADHCDAIGRLTANIRDHHFNGQFLVVLSSLKKECDLIEAKLKKAEKEAEAVQTVMKELDSKTKQEKKFSSSTSWRHASIANIKQPLLVLAEKLTMSTKTYLIEVEDRLDLREYIEEFRLLYIDFILPLAKAHYSSVYLCTDCWTILILRESSSKAKSLREGQLIPVSDLINKGKGLTVDDHQLYFDQALASNQGMLEDDIEYPSYMPAIILPGEAKKGNTGYDCSNGAKTADGCRAKHGGMQQNASLGKRQLDGDADDHDDQESQSESEGETNQREITAEELKDFGDITLYFKKGRKPLIISARSLLKISMNPKTKKKI